MRDRFRTAFGHWSPSAIALLLALPLSALFSPGPAHSAQCFIGKPCFAVAEPHLVERVCYLYFHETRTYKPGLESDWVVTLPRNELHPDQLHVEFLKLLDQKKFITLTKGTPIFSCQVDLARLKEAPDDALLVGGPLPEFNCRGFVSQWVPVRVINSGVCYWVGTENVQCEETPPTSQTFKETDYPARQ
jgi:hypothetical protein